MAKKKKTEFFPSVTLLPKWSNIWDWARSQEFYPDLPQGCQILKTLDHHLLLLLSQAHQQEPGLETD